MSGIVGSRLNIRGSGVIGSLGTDGQILTSAGAGQECGITLKDFNDYQKKDIIEVFNSTTTERII